MEDVTIDFEENSVNSVSYEVHPPQPGTPDSHITLLNEPICVNVVFLMLESSFLQNIHDQCMTMIWQIKTFSDSSKSDMGSLT